MTNAFPSINLSVSFMPTSALPIDARTYFTDMGEMESAALSAKEAGSDEMYDSNYYFGQILTYKSPDSTEVSVYKVVKKDETSISQPYRNLMSIATLTPQQINEVVERVIDDPRIVKIGRDVDILTNPAPDSGIVYNVDNGLRVNLAPNSGLRISEDGLEIVPDDEGNVKLTKTNKGLKGEFSWGDWDNGSE